MNLTTVKEIYKDREKFLDKEVSVGGWVRSVRGSQSLWIYRSPRRLLF